MPVVTVNVKTHAPPSPLCPDGTHARSQLDARANRTSLTLVPLLSIASRLCEGYCLTIVPPAFAWDGYNYSYHTS